ncbi:phage holin family protein [Beijerinckia sp. L45]|uniref:phage holin family protein n=1 Tax=Beijerinckia sp. L45 TaxID=1641855 RepID=UPI00131AA210|nr:phage holin family protein [Beijerinckia sp. L45]
MFGFIANLVGDALAPLIDSITEFSVRLLRKVALFLVAAMCLLVVLIALTIAFDLWIATLAGPIVAALAVAGLYFIVAILAVVFALRDGSSPAVTVEDAKAAEAVPLQPEINAQIDQFTKPILDILQRFGLRREQLAVFAGATMAKRLGPVPLVGCAIVVGFLVGRLWKSWRSVLEAGLAMSPLVADLFAQKPAEPEAPPPV